MNMASFTTFQHYHLFSDHNEISTYPHIALHSMTNSNLQTLEYEIKVLALGRSYVVLPVVLKNYL